MTNKNGIDGVVALDQTLGYSATSVLTEELRQFRHSAITIDAADVRHLGATCLQVLLAAAKAWRKDGLAFEIINCSPGFNEGLKRMGILKEELLPSEGVI